VITVHLGRKLVPFLSDRGILDFRKNQGIRHYEEGNKMVNHSLHASAICYGNGASVGCAEWLERSAPGESSSVFQKVK
jgi:hypothetical protein